MMTTILTVVLLLMLAALNIQATLAICKDSFSGRAQKAAQLLLVWLLPVVGAIIALAVYSRAEKPALRYRGAPDVEEDFGFSGGKGKNDALALDGDGP